MRSFLGLALCLPVALPAQAQDTFVINLRGAEISVLAEQVSEITGRTLVLDPNLSGDVSVVSAEPLDEDGVWALFQSILQVRGFVAVQSGTAWQVVPEARARTISGSTTNADAGSQDFVTTMLRLDRLPSAEAVRVLAPLVADSGYIEAIADPNAVLITDTRANVDRISAIARAFDSDENVRAEVIRFANADAVAVGAAIVEVLGEAGTGARLSVNASTNQLLVRGSPDDIQEIRDLARSMDVAQRQSPQVAISTQVFRMQFGDAAVVAEILRGTLGDAVELSNPVAADQGAAVAGEDGEGFVALDRAAPAASISVAIQASIETNSVIVRGTAAQLAEAGRLIHALDVRRPQVMIEAAIVEVSGDVAERLGVQLGFGDAAPPGRIAATSFGNGGVSLQGVLAALGATSSVALSTGLTVGAGNNDFGALVQALAQSSRARLLSTPSVTTLDNEPATIVVAQNVPFRTGSFATDGNTATPFTTIERRDVGITMNVVPRITAGNVVQLMIEQEVSSLMSANVEGAADLITNRRVINTTVLADDRGTVVLGGLITDDRQSQDNKVPGLGDVPVIGNLFKSRNAQKTTRTLFVFLRPTILRDRGDIREAAEQRYDKLQAADVTPLPRPLLTQREVRQLPLEIEGLY
ncbi:type II secretion system secretin GspD [Limimaricola cinnabarinus]|uniref:General secretion pathway protein D n=1 Tax=Limimaricola cinnabarinus LL-001 TaxID=1337093 RepID=U2YL18_9RHOB|nr:type II secretion system secretin GspD [Limimaricola cinnabarinus]GAD55731.1 general secretion pathway protein D [Limimaricola cinnabarinus LL-001]